MVKLSESERRFVDRLRREDKQRWIWFFVSILPGVFFLWLCWDALFAFYALRHVSDSQQKANLYPVAINIWGWTAGLMIILMSISQHLMNRERRLLLKLTAEGRGEETRSTKED